MTYLGHAFERGFHFEKLVYLLFHQSNIRAENKSTSFQYRLFFLI